MAEPWLTIIGLNEDGLGGLTLASRAALTSAEIVFGSPRHLALAGVRGREWGIPFSIEPVLAERGRQVVVLASGDPFWHGAGGSMINRLQPGEWRSFPVPSTFALAANRLGWRLEETICLGLHAAPLQRLRMVLAQGQKVICLLRDGAAVGELGTYLQAENFGGSTLHVMESLGGTRANYSKITPQEAKTSSFSAPVAVGVDCVGRGMPRASGLPDDLFEHDGQITKRPIRALTLSALAPRAGEVMWDIGAGSGSVSIEVLLAAPGAVAHAVEADTMRAVRALGNAQTFGVSHRWHLHQGAAVDVVAGLPRPDLVFVGGGASEELVRAIWRLLPQGARLVMNGVTLETEALLYAWHGAKGGQLLRIDLAEAGALGSRRGWEASRPVVQWSVAK
ncbi:precorrin-6y C5,15-methyltransferase (decarboxylating) subunit CbiE [bacterium]|nr:precorrin-6y C5,15-methyltransferase (decarboxylating) subunit CbiE [bacterium]